MIPSRPWLQGGLRSHIVGSKEGTQGEVPQRVRILQRCRLVAVNVGDDAHCIRLAVLGRWHRPPPRLIFGPTGMTAHCPRLVGSTPAKVRKSTIRNTPVEPLRVGSTGRQVGSAARYEVGSAFSKPRMREDHQIPRFQAVLKSSETKIPLVRARLGEAAFAIEWEAGRAMTLDQAEAMVAELEVATVTTR